VDDILLGLLESRRGHFLLESGLHGDLWLDLDALFWRPAALVRLLGELAERVSALGPEAICGPLVGGALVGYGVAEVLDLPFVSAARHEGEPGVLFSTRYVVPATIQPRLSGVRVVVVDDVINAGSAVRSTVTALRGCGATVVGLGALLRLGDAVLPYAADEGLAVESLVVSPNTLWTPDECALCLSGLPLEGARTR
jgi:orotate phosphoribosyltransferase